MTEESKLRIVLGNNRRTSKRFSVMVFSLALAGAIGVDPNMGADKPDVVTRSVPDIFYSETMPGDASAKQNGNVFTLSNNVLEIGWSLEEGHLLLTKVADKMKGRSYSQRSEVFEIHVDDTTRIPASACRLVGGPTLEVLEPVQASACTAKHLKGWQLAARFQHPATGMTVQWRAELHNGSHYVRQVLGVDGPQGTLTHVRCLEARVGKADVVGTAMAGNPVCSDHMFLGQELPMSQNLAPGGGVADQWSPADMQVKAITRNLKELKPGPLSIRFAYERGVHRIDVAEVQFVADGKVLSKDAHAGWSGIQTHANIYALNVPEGVTTGELHVTLVGAASDTDSFGKIAVSNGVLGLGRPGPVLCGLSCQLPLRAGKVYEFSSVLGVYPEGQLRRAFLRYLERDAPGRTDRFCTITAGLICILTSTKRTFLRTSRRSLRK